MVSKVKSTIEKSVPKKRGRKPKGGKIIDNLEVVPVTCDNKQNIILHLNCKQSDIVNTDNTYDYIEPFTFDNQNKKNDMSFQSIKHNSFNNYTNKNAGDDINHNNDTKIIEQKTLYIKLKELQHNLHTNNISDKKSACFWCTYDFENPSVYIPSSEINGNYNVYGCFCSPECATAYLMDESIDSSTKYERYSLLNYIYSTIYNYTKHIKPAANPYYTLNKFCGNLSIQEYRQLLNHNRILFIVEKPMTRVLPELHEENNDDEYVINKPITTFKVRKKKPSTNKAEIIKENFGF